MRTSTSSSTTSAALAAIAPRPFLKWAGGKGQLLPELLRRLPEKFGTYHEPFVGGGALFFALGGRGKITRAVLSDANGPVVDTYLAVRDRVEDVIVALHRHPNDAAHFYRGNRSPMGRASSSRRIAFLG